MPGKFGSFSSGGEYEPDFRIALPAAPPRTEGCLDDEWAANKVGVLFDAICAPNGVGVPCPLDCPRAVVWREHGAEIIGDCAVKTVRSGQALGETGETPWA